jgi:hypothetical protein
MLGKMDQSQYSIIASNKIHALSLLQHTNDSYLYTTPYSTSDSLVALPPKPSQATHNKYSKCFLPPRRVYIIPPPVSIQLRNRMIGRLPN